jgi:hypothetical protein
MATYTPFTAGDTVDSIDRVFASAWSNNTNELTTAFSSSTQYVTTSPTSSGAFFMEIYDKNPDSDTTAEVQYSIAYGNRLGSGSEDFNDSSGAEGFSAAKAVYNQYKSLVFGGDENQNFTFDGHTPDGIYVINVNRARYKNSIRMGTGFSFKLSGSTPTPNRLLELTDDSVTTSGSANAIRAGVGREFNIVSGSNGVRVGTSNTYVTDSGSYGFVYPDAGFIILNQDALDATGSANGLELNTNDASDTNGQNSIKLQNALTLGNSFILDSQEDIASKFYFVRVKNTEFNYTTNDSFTENDGTLKFDSMIDNPQTYITTVGLYNDNQDLLAVAKLSQPLPKDFTKEALIKVKLDY